VYRRMPQVADTIESPLRHGQLAIGARLRLARAIRQACYDQAFVLPNSFKSALVPWLAGVARRTGFVGELRYGLLTDARRLDEKHLPRMVERFAHLAGHRNQPLPDPVPRPTLRVTAPEVDAVLGAKGLARPARLACFCPGAEYGPAKRWPARYFAKLAQQLSRDGFDVWLLGSNKDAAIGAEIAQHAAGAVRDLTGKTSLDEAVVLLSIADQVVTNDSGLMHVAAALDRPLVAIYGSSSPDFTPPLSERARIVRLGIACSPCFERVCPLGHFDCMMRLDPERIAREIRSLSTGA
ncbi:MAG: lipopolysaccharide heptosyltransferase II, partial [Burkholderiales bacterium]